MGCCFSHEDGKSLIGAADSDAAVSKPESAVATKQIRASSKPARCSEAEVTLTLCPAEAPAAAPAAQPAAAPAASPAAPDIASMNLHSAPAPAADVLASYKPSEAALLAQLSRAVESGDASAVTAAIAGGADPDNVGAGSPPPLVIAALRGQAGVLTALLDGGADIDAADPHGGTALIAAAFGGHTAIVALLCKRGADPLRQTKDGGHALAASALKGDAASLKVLLERPDAATTVNLLDGRKASPIMLAAQSGHTSVVSMLVEAGGDPDLTDANSRSALDYAKDGIKVRRKRGELSEQAAGVLLARFSLVLQVSFAPDPFASLQVPPNRSLARSSPALPVKTSSESF